MKQEARQPKARKPYEKPAIVHSQKAEVRAVSCAHNTDQCGSTGPLTS